MARTALAVVAFCFALPASAQDDSVRVEARAHFEAGREHHQLGRFERAIEEYEAAYRLVPLPDLLFNIGQCHRNLKNPERAIFFFERFLQERPEAKDAELVRKLIAELEGELARRKAEETSTPTIASMPPSQPEVREVVPSVVPSEPPPTDEDGIHTQWWFWTLIVVGVAAAAGGAIALSQNGTPEGTIGTIDLR